MNLRLPLLVVASAYIFLPASAAVSATVGEGPPPTCGLYDQDSFDFTGGPFFGVDKGGDVGKACEKARQLYEETLEEAQLAEGIEDPDCPQEDCDIAAGCDPHRKVSDSDTVSEDSGVRPNGWAWCSITVEANSLVVVGCSPCEDF